MNAPFEIAPPVVIDDYYELRLYEMMPGRTQHMHHRMGVQVAPVFERLGMPRPLAYWDGYAGPMSPLYAYMLRWSDLDERMARWASFYSDPEWARIQAAGDANGQTVARTHIFIMRPLPIWDQFKTSATGPVGGIHELRLQEVLNDDPTVSHKSLGENDLPHWTKHGATVLGVFAMWYGTRLPQMAIMLSWPDHETRKAALEAHDTDSNMLAARKAERDRHGRPLFGRCDIHLMRPAPYGTAQANFAPLP